MRTTAGEDTSHDDGNTPYLIMQYSDQRWQHPPQPRPAYSQPLVIFGPGAAPVLTLAGQNAIFLWADILQWHERNQ